MSNDEIKKIIKDNVISLREAAEYMGFTRQNMHNLIKLGKLTPVVMTRGDTLFLKADVEEYSKNKKKRISHVKS